MNTMTKKQWKREQDFRAATALIRASDMSISEAYGVLDAFKRYERKLQRLAEIECNGYPKPTTEFRDGKRYSYNVEDLDLKAKCDRQEAKTTAAVLDLAKTHNLTVDFQGDPRGLMFQLTHDGHEINFYGE